MLIRMGGGAIAGSGGPQGNPHGQPAGCSVPKPSGVERSSELVLGLRAGLNQPRRKPAGQAADRNKCTLHPSRSRPEDPGTGPDPLPRPADRARVRRHPVLGGLIHEYDLAA